MKSNRVLKWLAVSTPKALFGSAEARADPGHVVPFVLWFNFMAGFVYVVAGVALFAPHQLQASTPGSNLQ